MMNAMVWSHTMGSHRISESRVFSFVVNGGWGKEPCVDFEPETGRCTTHSPETHNVALKLLLGRTTASSFKDAFLPYAAPC